MIWSGNLHDWLCVAELQISQKGRQRKNYQGRNNNTNVGAEARTVSSKWKFGTDDNRKTEKHDSTEYARGESVREFMLYIGIDNGKTMDLEWTRIEDGSQ